MAAHAAAAVDVAGGVFIYSRIFFSSLRARRLTFGALGEAAMLSRLPLGVKKSRGLYPSEKRGLKRRVPLTGVAGTGEGGAGGLEGEVG